MTPLAADPRYRSLDLWRGLACLMVVLDHAAIGLPPGAGWYYGSTLNEHLNWLVVQATSLAFGPSLFFVISGYCIAASVDSVRRKGKPALDFLVRRLWRTFPPYWVAMMVLAGLILLLDAVGLKRLHDGRVGLELFEPHQFNRAQWLGNLTLTETWRQRFFSGGESAVFTRVAWSLCYQEQFYAVCFLAVLVAPRRLYSVLTAATIGILGLRVIARDVGYLHRMEGLFPIYWHEFAVGLAVYARLNVALSPARRRAIDFCLTGLALAGLIGHSRSTVAASVFGALLIAMRRFDTQLATTRLLSPIRACGRRCYSIYLIHLPITVIVSSLIVQAGVEGFWGRTLVMMPVASLAAIAGGWFFFAAIESRFLEPPRLRQAALPELRVPAQQPAHHKLEPVLVVDRRRNYGS